MTPLLDRIRAHGGEVIRHRWELRVRRGRLPASAMDYLRQPDVRDRLMDEVWDDYDHWSERAAIREFDGGQGRDEAEAEAYAEVTADV